MLRTWRDDREACLPVTDNGIGIDTDDLERVFDLFVQVKRDDVRSRGGLGVGLTLVHRLVGLHGGTIEARSPGVGLGSTFTVRLPLALDVMDMQVPRVPRGTPEASGSATERPLRVLVVDDNVDAANSLAVLLRRRGHVVHLAEDGAQTRITARELLPYVVFLDISLPDTSGYDLAPRLRRIDGLENVVIVALTGYGSEADRARAVDAGFDHHLTKPTRLAAILVILGEIADSVPRMCTGVG